MDYREKMHILNEFLSKSFRSFLKPSYAKDMGHYLTIKGERYKTTDRGDLSISMPDSRLYDALYAYLYENGEKPTLHGEISLVVERHLVLTAFLVKWELRADEYEKKLGENNKIYLDIDFIRWGDEV